MMGRLQTSSGQGRSQPEGEVSVTTRGVWNAGRVRDGAEGELSRG